jgi:hypothetical protein
MREAKGEPKVTVGAVIPIGWRDELEEMAKAERKTVSELVRDFIDKGLHGQKQAAQCHDEVARQVIRIIIELLQLYYAMEGGEVRGE